MGIGGLLPLLKEIQQPAHVREWKGKTVAVDAYVWLHRGAYGCAEDLALGRPTIKYVNYAMHRVRMLKHFGVTPMLVFDGGLLPSKMGTEDAREAKRKDALARGRAFLAEGRGAQARECFVKAIDVTPAMAFQLIKALRREGVQYVVAPYEADPQLAYLEKAGLVDAVMTEDSDLLVFGCRNVLFKLDGEGNCVSIARDDLARCREYNFAGWGETEFRQMAILSGCDYLDSVVGLGLKTAYRLLRKYKTPEKVIQFVRLEGQLTVPRTYLDEFRRAEKTFLHQHVFDPVDRVLKHLTPLPEGVTADDLPFIGPVLDADFARGIADGEIDPITKLAMVDLVPDAGPSTSGPFKPAPFKPTSAAAAAKPAAGSLLSYFSRAPAASTSGAANPARSAKAKARVVLVHADKGNGAGAEEEQAPRTSKFFGTAAAKPATVASKNKGKARAVDPPVGEEDGIAADDSGFVDCIELPPSSDDRDAEEALRAVELCVEMRSTVGADAGREVDRPVSEEPAAMLDKGPPPSLPTAISSPIATPPRKRVRLSDSPLSVVACAAAGAAPIPLSDAGVSSPAQSTVAQAGWDADDLSSPVPAPAPAPVAVRVKLEPGSRKPEALAPIELSSDPIILTSSPGAPTPRAAAKPSKPPRKPKAPPRSASGKIKPPPRRSRDVGVVVRTDEAASSSERKWGKRRAEELVQEEGKEGEEGADEAVKAVAASWRAKFMMPAGSKTPLGRTAAGRPLPPTPQTTTRPPSHDMTVVPGTTLSVATKKQAATSSRKRPSSILTAQTSARAPLSPRSSNRLNGTAQPRPRSPLKKQRSLPDQVAAEEQQEKEHVHGPPIKKRRSLVLPVPSSEDAVVGTSSSPVVVTNPRLLAFRFTGTVRRD